MTFNVRATRHTQAFVSLFSVLLLFGFLWLLQAAASWLEHAANVGLVVGTW